MSRATLTGYVAIRGGTLSLDYAVGKSWLSQSVFQDLLFKGNS